MLCLLFALTSLGLFTSGCQLFNDSVKKAQEVAEKREAELAEAWQNWQRAGEAVDELLQQYENARVRDDRTTMEAIEDILPDAIAKAKIAEDAYMSAEDVFKAAVADFKDAKSTSDYLGTVFGWITAGVSALFGGAGTAVNLVGKRRAREALTGATASIEKLKVDNDAWKGDGGVRSTMLAGMSQGAKKELDRARP